MLPNLPPAPTLSRLRREEASPLPHHGDDEVVGAHDEDLAGGGPALRGGVRTKLRGQGLLRGQVLRVIDQLPQGIGF